MHRQKRLVVWPLTCPWRVPLTATIACRTSTCSAFTIRSLHSTFPLRTSTSASVAPETDLSCKTSAPTTVVLPPQQQQPPPPQQQKQSKDYRTRIQRSLDKLGLKDLSCLLMASGLPLSGTKPVLTDRLVTHLTSIMDKVDHLEPEFFLHNNNNNNTYTYTNMYTSYFDNNSTPPPPPRPLFFSTATTDATPTPPTGLKPPGHSHNSQNLNQIDPDVLARIKDKILPRSIVSMDIGIRNLAWVELSKDGEILRWAVEDLLVPSSTASNDPQVVLHLEDEEEGGHPATDGSSSHKKPHGRGVSGSKSKQRVKKEPAPPYDPRAVALRVDKVMRTILQESRSVGGIILERQRFRSGGMHTMLDSTFKCGVVEGMIHTWFAFWQREQQQKLQQRRGGVMAMLGDEDEDEEKKETVFIESVPPRAVAVRWGIGAAGAKAAIAPSQGQKKRQALVLDTIATDENKNNAVSDVVEEGEEVGVLTESMSPALAASAPLTRAPKRLTYHYKKAQSKAIVDNWIYPSQDEHLVDPASSGVNTESLWSQSKFQVRCSPEMREWYSQEQKRDDLSDCLLQAVAWFEWRGCAVQEAVERSMPMPMRRCPIGSSVDDDGAAAVRAGGLRPQKRRSSRKA